MNEENPRIIKIVEMADALLKKAEEKKKRIISEIRSVEHRLDKL